jgi:Iron-containing alcohol dehydrogenase/Aldehyde dehydrogenase family
MAEPIGVIFSLTPITNPTSTVLFKCILAIKTRNAVIFSPHPRAWRCSSAAVRVMYETAVRHGAPEGVFSCLESHTLEDNAYLMRHKDVRLIDATGGPGAVRAAHSSGKPALGVGAGNTAVYLEKTADLNTAVVDIIISKTFDNGTICASEQTVVIDDEIYGLALKKFSELGGYICNANETKLLERAVMDPQTGVMQPLAVGQKATDIARFVGLPVEPNTKLLIAPIHGVGREHPLSLEKLFPGEFTMILPALITSPNLRTISSLREKITAVWPSPPAWFTSTQTVTLADYSPSPDVAIVDPQFVMSMPKVLTADTGIDCLTHALEAGVSNYASSYTDSNAMQAIRLAFKYLPIAYENPRDEEARA